MQLARGGMTRVTSPLREPRCGCGSGHTGSTGRLDKLNEMFSVAILLRSILGEATDELG